jgi:hypothetical protein
VGSTTFAEDARAAHHSSTAFTGSPFPARVTDGARRSTWPARDGRQAVAAGNSSA